MAYIVELLPDQKVVSITAEGKLNFSMVKQFTSEAIKLSHTYKCNNFLIDHTKTTLQEGIYKLHTDGEELEEFGFHKTDRIAIVISRKKDDKHFIEKAYLELGWSNLKYFDTVKEAIKWLVEDK